MAQRLTYAASFITVTLSAILVFSGCEFGGPGADKTLDPEDRDALIEEWKRLSQGGLDPMNLAAGEAVAARLARRGPEELLPLLALLGATESSPTAKVYVTSCLTPFVTIDLQEPILALTVTEQEATTRACAVRLLGLIPSPDTTQRLRDLVSDPELRVRFEAHVMLVLHGDMDILALYPNLWDSGKLSEEQRSQLVMILPEDHAATLLPILREALIDVALDLPARQHALKLLAQEGHTEADRAALRKILEQEPETILAQAVEQALPTVEQRIANGTPPETADKD